MKNQDKAVPENNQPDAITLGIQRYLEKHLPDLQPKSLTSRQQLFVSLLCKQIAEVVARGEVHQNLLGSIWMDTENMPKSVEEIGATWKPVLYFDPSPKVLLTSEAFRFLN